MNIKNNNDVVYTQVSRKTGEHKLYEGKWKKSGNEITFLIEGINHSNPMEATIDDNGIIFIPSQGSWNAEQFFKSTEK